MTPYNVLQTERVTDNGALHYEWRGWAIEIHPDRPWTVHMARIVGDGVVDHTEVRVVTAGSAVECRGFAQAVPQPVRRACQQVATQFHRNWGDLKRLANALKELAAPLNEGRGVSSADTVRAYLWAGNRHRARIVCYNESDKLGSYPDLRAWILTNLFHGCSEHPWSYLESARS